MWAAHEPLTREARRQQILGWERAWDEAREFVLGILCGGRIVGGCGLHPETGTGALEIGYWVHADFTRRGVATRAACLLTDAALGLPEVAYVEIHHDKANLASSGVPRRLGYVLVGEGPDEPHAPGESGIECRWRMDRETWRRMRRDHSPADG
jgi:RimJ/RimL family protein N-acetyltransferase